MNYFNVPNCVCYLRVVLCFFSFWYFNTSHNEPIFLVITLVVMLMDALDGYLARLLNQTSIFGAKLDVYSDRVVELSYWLYFALLGRLGFWVFLIFLVRGLVVDILTLRSDKPLGESWLRSSRFMRFVMGLAKILSFISLIIMPEYFMTMIFVYLAVISNLLRGFPVVYDSLFSNTKK
jgi:phosphatidylglycerophosphate synthase